MSANANRPPPPTPTEQLAFLGNIERLLSEGQFVATYKYALLIAIADLAVQLGSDDGSELKLPLRAIAEQFIELYWRHSAPYGTGAERVLIQNSGRQASVISIVANLQQRNATLMRAQASPFARNAGAQCVIFTKVDNDILMVDNHKS